MEEFVTIVHKIDLLLHLIDAVTGRVIIDRSIEVTINNKPFIPMFKADGDIIFMNIGREASTVGITCNGYYSEEVRVDYKELSESLPYIAVDMVPNERYKQPCLELTGIEPGITSIVAVNLNQPLVLFGDFNERQKTLTVFNPHMLSLENVFYGIINKETHSFEIIEIEKQVSSVKFKLKGTLKTMPATQSPICRLIFGKIMDENGRYILRLPDTAQAPLFIIRKSQKDGEEFSGFVE